MDCKWELFNKDRKIAFQDCRNNIGFYTTYYTEEVLNLIETSNKYEYQRRIQNSVKDRGSFLRNGFTAIFCVTINETIAKYQTVLNDIQKFYDSNLVVAP